LGATPGGVYHPPELRSWSVGRGCERVGITQSGPGSPGVMREAGNPARRKGENHMKRIITTMNIYRKCGDYGGLIVIGGREQAEAAFGGDFEKIAEIDTDECETCGGEGYIADTPEGEISIDGNRLIRPDADTLRYIVRGDSHCCYCSDAAA